MSVPQVFCISGLGLSERIFDNLALPSVKINHLNWIEPLEWESLSDYASRLSQPLLEVEEEIVLIGHSFGGVLAQEIAKKRIVKHIFLISSMVNPTEAPSRLKFLVKFRLHHLLTKQLILLSFPFWAYSHSFRIKALRTLFRESVRSLSSHYFRWALWQIATWTGVSASPVPCVSIHGDKDVTFLIEKKNKVEHVIPGGDHNMIYSRGREISQLISRYLQ